MSARCPSCQTTYGDDAKFCPRDGTKLETVAQSSPARPFIPPTPPPAPPAVTPATSPAVPVAPPDSPPSSHVRVFQPIGAENRATSQRSGPSGAPAATKLDHTKLVGETLDARYTIT